MQQSAFRQPCFIWFMWIFPAACFLAHDATGAPSPPGPENRSADRNQAQAALQELGDLIGSWRGTGTLAQKSQGSEQRHWVEKLHWVWDFKGKQPSIQLRIEDGRFYRAGVLTYNPESKRFALQLETLSKVKETYQGVWKNRQLTLECEDQDNETSKRIVIQLLHQSRMLFRQESKPRSGRTFTRIFEVGATKEGVEFAKDANKAKECVVTGGAGTIAVTYKGETYYVCCTGCLDAFREDPDGIMKEYFARQKKKE